MVAHHFKFSSFLKAVSVSMFMFGLNVNAANSVSMNGQTYTCEGNLICSNGACSCSDRSGNIVINGSSKKQTDSETSVPAGYSRHSNGGGLVADTSTVAESVILGPNVIIKGSSELLGSSQIGPNSVITSARIVNSVVGPNSTINRSLLYNTRLGPNSTVEGMELIGQSIGPNSTLKGNYPQPRRN